RYVAAWVGKAAHKAKADRVRRDADDRDGSRRCFEMLHEGGDAAREDHVWLGTNHITRQFRVILRSPLAGVSLHDQVASLDIPEPTKFWEQGADERAGAGFSQSASLPRRDHEGHAVNFLGYCGADSCRAREQ